MTLAGIAALPVGAVAAYATYQKLIAPHLLTYSEQGTTVLDAAWSLDGTRVASSGWLDGGTVKIWNAATGKTLQTCRADNPGPAMIPLDVVWSADGKYVIAFVGSNREMVLTAGSRIVEMVQVWDVATGQRVRSIPVMEPATVNDLGTETDRPLVYKWALNERYLAAVNAQDMGILEIWEIATGNKIATLSAGGQRPPSKVQEIVWAPDSEKLAIQWIAQDFTNQQYDRTIEIWNIATLNKIATLHIESQSYLAQITWAPDSRTLALILQDTDKPLTGEIWDALAGKKVQTIQPAVVQLSAKPWSPNGKYLLQGNTLFDVETGNRIITYKLEGGVNSLAWSPDGTRVALDDVVYSGHGFYTTSRSTLSVLDALSGRQIAKYGGGGLFGSGGTSGNVAWSPDGKHVMVVGQKVDIWKAE
ncbi:MAG: hypothetical protein ACXVA4_01435 [Ktedonobacterales bacterium]